MQSVIRTLMTKKYMRRYNGNRRRGILAVGQSVEETTKEMLAQLVDEESELISLYFGQDVLEEDAENFAQEVEELYPDVDVDVHMGGQPIYYYVLSVE